MLQGGFMNALILEDSMLTGQHFLIETLPPGSKFQRASEFRRLIYTIIRDAHSSFPEHKHNPDEWSAMADKLTDENWEYF